MADLLKAAARNVLSEVGILKWLQSDVRLYRRMALLGAGMDGLGGAPGRDVFHSNAHAYLLEK